MANELREQLFLLKKYERIRAKENLLDFAKATMPTFKPNWFHDKYYEVLSQFADGEIKKLMVFVPPQHGKSEGSTRRLPAYILGRDPDKRVAVVSYSSTKARKFNREIQRIIEDQSYTDIFLDTKLSSGSDGYARTMDEIEIVGHQGGIKTVGVGGPLTGEPVDILIMDDIYKDAKAAWSEVTRESIQDWYNTVADTRLHNDSQQLIVFTRWHERDLAGYLLSKDSDWTVFTFPAIKEGPPSDYDPRQDGEALWPERHSVEKLNGIKVRDPYVFGNLYQGDPKAREVLLYKEYKLYRELPNDAVKKRAVIDTADTGEDFLCSIVYAVSPSGYYLLDVYYTAQGMEVTEEKTAVQLTKHVPESVKIESNNGGRGFARNVEKKMRELGNFKTSVNWYHQTENKEVRIFTKAAEVQNMIHYPEGWDIRWPEFYSNITGYMATGKNKHDDGPDTLTMLVEAEQKLFKVAVA
jgi:predicted phage terminase large subunit-like protein